MHIRTVEEAEQFGKDLYEVDKKRNPEFYTKDSDKYPFLYGSLKADYQHLRNRYIKLRAANQELVDATNDLLHKEDIKDEEKYSEVRLALFVSEQYNQ